MQEILVFRSQNTAKKSRTYLGLKGRPETQYLGLTKVKNSNLKIYDKRQEQLDNNQPPEFGEQTPHTRIEFRRPLGPKDKSLVALPQAANPLKHIQVFDMAKSPSEDLALHDPSHWLFFIDYCRHHGFDKGLSKIDDQKIAQVWSEHVEECGSGVLPYDDVWDR